MQHRWRLQLTNSHKQQCSTASSSRLSFSSAAQLQVISPAVSSCGRELPPAIVNTQKYQVGAWFGAAGQNIRKLVKDGFVIKKPMKIHSRSRAREAQLAKSKGRHTGYGVSEARLLAVASVALLQCWRLSQPLRAVAPHPKTALRCWSHSSLGQYGSHSAGAQASGGVPGRRGCQQRSCGSGGCACCAACSRSTATPRRSTSTYTTTCTSRSVAPRSSLISLDKMQYVHI
jgi:Ribosomal protein L19e